MTLLASALRSYVQEQMYPWLKSADYININRFNGRVYGFVFEEEIGQTHGHNWCRKL